MNACPRRSGSWSLELPPGIILSWRVAPDGYGRERNASPSIRTHVWGCWKSFLLMASSPTHWASRMRVFSSRLAGLDISFLLSFGFTLSAIRIPVQSRHSAQDRIGVRHLARQHQTGDQFRFHTGSIRGDKQGGSGNGMPARGIVIPLLLKFGKAVPCRLHLRHLRGVSPLEDGRDDTIPNCRQLLGG